MQTMRPYNADQVQAVLPALCIEQFSWAVSADRRSHTVIISIESKS